MIGAVQEDKRIRRTKKLLRQALTRLMQQKDFQSITVTDVVREADINRGTFYAHYRDVYDLREKIEAEMIEDFRELIADLHPSGTSNLQPVLARAVDYLEENREIVRALVRGTGVVEQRDGGVVRVDGVAQGACLLRHGLRALRIVPEARLRDLRVERRELGGFIIDVQEAVRIGDALGNLFDIFQFFICHSYSILPAKRPALACRALECIVSSRLQRRRIRAIYPCRGTS